MINALRKAKLAMGTFGSPATMLDNGRSKMTRVPNKLFGRAGATFITALVLAGMACGVAGMARATDGQLHFTLVAVNNEVVTNDDKHMFVLSGYGTFSSDAVEGNGTYLYLDGATEVPKTILSAGSWEATRVLRWTPAEGGATYGRVHPGVLDLRIDIIPDQGPVIKGATLRINCNVGFAGIQNKDPDTGEPLAEGYWLTIPGSAFLSGAAAVGPFVPRDPILGVTEIAR